MADLVTVVDRDGNEARVSSKWLARWPKDFSPVKGESKTASAGSNKTGGTTKKEAENGA